ncbi:6-phosphofructokinase 1 [Methanolinea mesophila]|uniref:6-phosphofructokinase n=1 Tax=Methanolinea mesophila TaxID=547055 RepID=UPI001AE562F7|nr:6-phosphofructokinase [Methanolinea mesophila]MBP1927595.1 6-phosphofructokinase 1 [Methanolinea mesophila]
MKKIGILTSGGDAPGMNACIRSAVRTALAAGIEPVGVLRGFSGLIRGEFTPLDRSVICNIIHRGGTILETSRSAEFETREGRSRAASMVRDAGIDGLVLIGGDGTFHGGTLFQEETGIEVAGVPATIDNDVYGTDYCVGFDSAINCALEAIDRIRDTALSHERLFFIEVMGRDTGFIALESGIAGGAEEVLIPEDPMSEWELISRLREYFRAGKRSAIVVVAEADNPGWSFRLSREVHEATGIDSRVCVLGHVQRGGSPTARDRVLGSMLGSSAVNALQDGSSGCVAGELHGDEVLTPMKETWMKKKSLDSHLVMLKNLLSEE